MRRITNTIGIDWSGARGAAHARCIGWACVNLTGNHAVNFDTGPVSRAEVAARLLSLTEREDLSLAGIDANLSIAESVLASHFGRDATAMDLWNAVEKACAADAGFFGGAFAQAYPQLFWLSGKKPSHLPDPLPRRLTETACGQAGLGYPESPFKLIGPKQVGKGGLAAMRLVHHLKQQAGSAVTIWPFEETTAQTRLVISEIFPRLFWRQAGGGTAKVRALETMNAGLLFYGLPPLTGVQELSDHQSDALISAAGLAAMMRQAQDDFLSAPVTSPRIRREGWILGLPLSD